MCPHPHCVWCEYASGTPCNDFTVAQMFVAYRLKTAVLAKCGLFVVIIYVAYCRAWRNFIGCNS